jgi:flagellar FliJ protein
MNAPASLATLLELHCADRDAALGAHRQALAALQAAERQAGQLDGYRRDYMQRYGAQPRQAGAIVVAQCYHGFMARLDDAVAQQGHALQRAIAQAEQAKQTLLAAEMRVASVRKLIERRVAEGQRVQARSEQKASDEFASRAAWQRLAGSGAFGAA